MTARIKKGDRVFINCGKDNGKTGEVIRVLGMKAVVKDVNVYKRHQKQDQKNEGGVLNKEMPISISNLMLLDKKLNKPTRVGYRAMKDKKKVRISRVSEEQIDG